MTISRKTYLFVAALFVFLMASAPTEVEAQDGGGLTCGWCVHGVHNLVEVPGGYEGDLKHVFPYGGNGCGWQGHDIPHVECSRCGGTSDCHTRWRDGFCHIPCGPEGDAVVALSEIEAGLDDDDMAVVASALRMAREGVVVEFIPEGGRIDIVLPCNPTRVYHTIPVPPDVRTRLLVELGSAAGARNATPGSLP